MDVNVKPKKEYKYNLGLVITLSIVCGILVTVAAAFIALSVWYRNTFDVDFKTLIQVITSPTTGTGTSTVNDIIRACVPTAVITAVVYSALAVVFAMRKPLFRIFRIAGASICAASVVFSAIFTVSSFGIDKYVETIGGDTNLYEQYYIDPNDVLITADGKPKNLIYIYLESMETTYASKEAGGIQKDGNYIPGLTALTKEGVTFTDKDKGLLGGFHSTQGAKWTIAGLLSTTAGIPFAFPVGSNDMSDFKEFAPKLTTLGDILEEKGYKNEFLCGSDATFGGRRNYFTQHGNYEIFDLYTARNEDYIAKNYKVWWGYEDKILYDIARDEVTELAAGDQPFNFTMLTVDTHHVNGYVCDVCDKDKYGTLAPEDKLKTVVECSDKLVTDFIEWCKTQDWYEDTVIVITGDHPRMDKTLIGNTAFYDRTIYNCILNSDVTPAEGSTANRTFTSLDMFPTTLAAMGFKIEGNRLGLGVNMFSGEKTVAERMGYDAFDLELGKKSQYYNDLTGFKG